MPKIAVIIPTYVPRGQVEYNCPARSTINPDYHEHFNENKFETIKFVLECHKYYNPGIDYDLIIIDNDSQDNKYKDFLKTQNNVYYRENKGFSFGAYRYGFEKFGNKYDYYLFQEQDVAPCKDGWLKEIKENLKGNIGAVGNMIEGGRNKHSNFEFINYIFEHYIPHRDIFANLCGAFTFTSYKILKEATDKHGWFILPCGGDEDILTVTNELAFQLPITESGYELYGMNDGTRLGTHGVMYVDAKDYTLPLCPMVHSQSRFFHKTFKKVFRWNQ